MKETIEERIERIALLSFSEQGYHETRTSEIAKNARVSETSIFRLFKTKRDLYLHVLSKYGSNVTLKQNPILSTLTFDDAVEDLTMIAGHFLNFYFENIHLTRIYLSNAIQISEILGYEFLIYPDLKDFLKKYLDEMNMRGKLSLLSADTFNEIFLSSVVQDVIFMTTFEKIEVLDDSISKQIIERWKLKVEALLKLFDVTNSPEDWK
ncbi:TetR/AcrR family transcriptional regulator [Proteiniclasticum sp. SCR006]|uniref:TetR/AcrR family transcriptional regulator n=1 Tax=Proteiniclasticum aestuarii TaxID=2817862 RepID=A0A939HBH4_9CLOT|nr:TetR/AcrR family transcriptional regulator [Proteiniclasticum aestuarii]MBO1265285.1 TetR/AcrR family transcriptional regulator [Proteiniclasticum aestuarii]